MHGGFLGVEVFFVVSGYLITSLLLEEKESAGGVHLSQFWLRRARRLLPALFAVLIAVGVWVALFGSAQQQSDLHRDYLPGIFYFANWGQIFGGAQYFGNFSPLRHLWSLAVEEQWYLLWPIAFVLLTRESSRRRPRAMDTGRRRSSDGAHLVLGGSFRAHIRSHQLLVPLDPDPVGRIAARRRCCVRVAPVEGQGSDVGSRRCRVERRRRARRHC